MQKKLRKRVGRKIRWLVEISNSNTNKTTRQFITKTYDEVTRLVNLKHKRNKYVSISAVQVGMNGEPIPDGLVVAECSRIDEQLFSDESVLHPTLEGILEDDSDSFDDDDM